MYAQMDIRSSVAVSISFTKLSMKRLSRLGDPANWDRILGRTSSHGHGYTPSATIYRVTEYTEREAGAFVSSRHEHFLSYYVFCVS
jgi:hypothetical protein